MDITDSIVFLLSVFFMFRGFSRGFMRSLLGPFSIIVATIISIIYYQITEDLILSLIIGLVGPFILHLLLKFLLKIMAKATNTETPPGFLSRLGGALLTLAWGWVFIIFTLLLLALLPPWSKTLAAIHNNVTRSLSYTIAKPLEDRLFSASKQDVSTVAAPASNNDARSLADDPRFQKVRQDPEIQKEIEAHDMVKLMSNPKMMDLTREILSDPATMKKVMAIYRNQQQATSSTSESSK
jgi:uncharacterized membrane protein required for colicin V production